MTTVASKFRNLYSSSNNVRQLSSFSGISRISSSHKSSHCNRNTQLHDQQHPVRHIHDIITSSSLSDYDKNQHQQEFQTINSNTPYNLCFLRHGQSTWNRDNRFIGWNDTPLTDDGVLEARVAGRMLKNSGILFDEVHTSLLRRCIRTTNLVLMELEQEYIPVHKHWRLNERHYGDLVGKNKKETVKLFGKERVKRWRRSYDEPPPAMAEHHQYHPKRDPRYRHMLDHVPSSESLKDTKARSRVYWDNIIAPNLRDGKTLLIVGHENNLRSLIMRLEDIPKEEVIHLCLPRAVPLAYRLHPETLKPLDRPDGKLDEATGFLRGEWLGGDKAVSDILERDRKQVYDVSIEKNLETCDEDKNKWKDWMNLVVGNASPEARATTRAEENAA